MQSNAGPVGLTIGDLDGDNKLDLVTGNYNVNTFSVLRNQIACLSVPCAQPPTFLNDPTIVLDASCTFINDGLITLVPLTGTAPFQYSINGGVTYVSGPAIAFSFMNLGPGFYQLRIKDANGCESAVVTREVKKVFGCPVLSLAIPTSKLEEASSVLKTFPNPNHGQFRMQLADRGEEKMQVSVIDAKGSVVQTRSLTASEGNFLDINLQGKAKGLYFVRVVSDKGVQVQKVTVQ